MTEEQTKLMDLMSRRQQAVDEASKLQKELQQKSEFIMRIEGALEAFAMLGIKPPEEESGEG